jgi:hypothetical protein
MKVYEAIAKVAAAMSHEGISKARKNTQQGYNFRGIDDVLNALSAALSAAGLVILPRVTAREQVERTSAKGGALFYTTVCVEFDLVAVEDGSKHTVTTYGEAMDSADKATNKAMSAAYKYLALLTFCIPTEATPENDADFTTHEVKPKVDRTLVMKVTRSIREHVANQRPMGAIQEWEIACELGEDFGKDVWAGLTTPERDYIREHRDASHKAKAA